MARSESKVYDKRKRKSGELMYRAWSVSANDPSLLARLLEAHLNEFAAEVISVGYAVTDTHHVLAVYRPVGPQDEPGVEAALAEAESIVGL